MDSKDSAPIFCAGITGKFAETPAVSAIPLTRRRLAYHAVNECELSKGDWLAVIGCGGLGLFAIQYAKAMGFKTIGIDVNDATLTLAREAGADLTFNSMTQRATYVDELKKATGGGAHAAAVFSAAKPAYDGAPAVLRMGGLIMAIGLMAKPIEIDSIAFMRGLFRIQSTSTGPPHKMPKAIEFSAKHNIKAKVSEHSLEDLPNMIEMMRNGTSTGRMAVVF